MSIHMSAHMSAHVSAPMSAHMCAHMLTHRPKHTAKLAGTDMCTYIYMFLHIPIRTSTRNLDTFYAHVYAT